MGMLWFNITDLIDIALKFAFSMSPFIASFNRALKTIKLKFIEFYEIHSFRANVIDAV